MRFMNSNYQDPRNFSQAPQQSQQAPTLQQAIAMMQRGDTFGATNILQSLVGLPQRDYSFQQNAMAQPAQNLGMGQATQFTPPSQYASSSYGPQQPAYSPPSYPPAKPQGLLGAAPSRSDTGRTANPYTAPAAPAQPSPAQSAFGYSTRPAKSPFRYI